jgi:hypothetical protein
VSRRLTRAILLLYPRPVRKRHGPEIAALIDDLIARDGRSRARLFIRLAVDGLVQRTAATTTAWTVAAVLAATSLAGLTASDFAAASAHQGAPRPIPAVAPERHTHQTAKRHHDPASLHASRRGRPRGDLTSPRLSPR